MMEQEDGFVGPVNLGNPDEFSIRELAEQVIGLCGSDSTLVQEPLPEDNPVRRRPDITLARQKLGVAAARPAARGPRKDHRLVPPHRSLSLPPANTELLIHAWALVPERQVYRNGGCCDIMHICLMRRLCEC
jgi:hypothetical protein